MNTNSLSNTADTDNINNMAKVLSLLLQGKKLTLSFATMQELKSFRTMLATYKRREEHKFLKLGMRLLGTGLDKKLNITTRKEAELDSDGCEIGELIYADIQLVNEIHKPSKFKIVAITTNDEEMGVTRHEDIPGDMGGT